jgi:uncharacterized membrane protein
MMLELENRLPLAFCLLLPFAPSFVIHNSSLPSQGQPFVLIPPLNEISPVRIILGLPLVLFLPGYALIAALFPRKDDLDGIERIALSFGLSIAISPLLGLGLNYTPFGLRFYVIVTPKEGEKFTEFYVLGSRGKAEEYPINLTLGKAGAVIKGIINHEYATVTYPLELKLNGDVID